MTSVAITGLLAAAAILWLSSARPRPAAGPRSVRRAGDVHGVEEPIELVLDLSASLMDSGLPLTQLLDCLGQSIEACASLRTVARCLEMNMDWDRAWEPVPGWLEPLRRSLDFSHHTGAPAAELLRSAAALSRREREQRVARLGAQFGTKLVLPLGACALPAFVALGVVPLIIALFPAL